MNNIPKNSIQLNFRQAERRDIPLLAQWILDQDCRAQHLLDYPTTIAQVKNQLLKELAITELIFSSKMLFVAELNNTALVGVVFVRAIDWKNKHCVMDMYCPKEVRATDLPPIIKQNAYNYLFRIYKCTRSITIACRYIQPSANILPRLKKNQKLSWMTISSAPKTLRTSISMRSIKTNTAL